MKTETTTTSYDEVPYESHPFPQTHPQHLAAIVLLLGLRPAAVTKCRVLELGCAAGGNLIPMAATLPESEFVGVDLSRVEIEEGLKLISELNLTNIELKNLSIAGVDETFGKFDYIICHGVYSWVPSDLQEKILNICKANLAPVGIAYVSYNTYPGWHMRGMIRDMLIYHSKQFSEAKVRVRQARNFLDFLGRTASREATPYSLLLKTELESFQRSSDAYLFHEHLEEVNEPIYFHQFADKAAAKGLKYVAETDLRVMVPSNYPAEIANVIQMLAHDHIHMEQYLDFVRNTMFRQSLLCHDHHQPNYNINPNVVRRLLLASPAKPKSEKPDLTSSDAEPFTGPSGVVLEAREPIIKSAMLHLSETWPRAVSFEELFKQAMSRLKLKTDADEQERHAQRLAEILLNCHVSAGGGLMELHTHQPTFVTDVSDRPTASALARAQAARCNRVTNLRHELTPVSDLERFLLQLLNGTVDAHAIADNLAESIARAELNLEELSAPSNTDTIDGIIKKTLHSLVSKALLHS